MDFPGLLQRLVEHEVAFVVVGGYASMILGSDLLTQDLDVCIRLDDRNLHRLYDGIADLHPCNRMHPDRPPVTRAVATSPQTRNLYLSTDLGPLDCLGSILGLGEYPAVEQLSQKIDLPFGKVRILGIDGLIAAKEALGREKDRLGLLKLRAIRERLRDS